MHLLCMLWRYTQPINPHPHLQPYEPIFCWDEEECSGHPDQTANLQITFSPNLAASTDPKTSTIPSLPSSNFFIKFHTIFLTTTSEQQLYKWNSPEHFHTDTQRPSDCLLKPRPEHIVPLKIWLNLSQVQALNTTSHTGTTTSIQTNKHPSTWIHDPPVLQLSSQARHMFWTLKECCNKIPSNQACNTKNCSSQRKAQIKWFGLCIAHLLPTIASSALLLSTLSLSREWLLEAWRASLPIFFFPDVHTRSVKHKTVLLVHAVSSAATLPLICDST